ncbi:uncharacterized protein LOC109718855 [Ananas comosus]|uniref:Uncharacterized protein LOC109718855 n=1 Tax=Ananas comosus TaxID=4615 RepID=A0A6P5G6L4_ANACO|nr:uncharacterized protein LOC109718855 [Ananas comosus]
MAHHPLRFSSLLRPLLLLSAALSLLLLLLLLLRSPSSPSTTTTSFAAAPPSTPETTKTSPRHLLFGIASSSRSFSRRREILRLWWRPGAARGVVFLDSPLPSSDDGDDRALPPTRVSADASRFPYSFRGGLRSAIRVARIVKELVDDPPGSSSSSDDDHGDVRWVVLGDDDTVFVLENLVDILAKYDWREWYYVGGRSEMADQNAKHSFGMAFGGGGIAISYPLARVLARVLDSCLMRYPHLYGSDARIYACLAELGVELSYEPGFHQIDLHGDISGLLTAHPLSPLISLHHFDRVAPLFPGMNHTMALKHFFKAVEVDPRGILQQTVCYDRLRSRTVSVSWGYAVQVFEGNQLLPDVLSVQKTFFPWKRGRNASSYGVYMFNTREYPRDQCQRPTIFFLKNMLVEKDRIQSNYSRHLSGKCLLSPNSARNLRIVTVNSQRLIRTIGKAPRRRCCNVLRSSSDIFMNIEIRKCKDDELIAMRP